MSKDPKRQGLHLVNIQKKSILGREHVKPLKKERPGVLEEKEGKNREQDGHKGCRSQEIPPQFR